MQSHPQRRLLNVDTSRRLPSHRVIHLTMFSLAHLTRLSGIVVQRPTLNIGHRRTKWFCHQTVLQRKLGQRMLGPDVSQNNHL